MQIKQASTRQLHMGTTCARLRRCLLDPDHSREHDRNIFATRLKTRGGNPSFSSKVSRLSTRMCPICWSCCFHGSKETKQLPTSPSDWFQIWRSKRVRWRLKTHRAHPDSKLPRSAGRQVRRVPSHPGVRPITPRPDPTRQNKRGHADATGPKSPLMHTHNYTHTHTHRRRKKHWLWANLVLNGQFVWAPRAGNLFLITFTDKLLPEFVGEKVELMLPTSRIQAER